jgi:hypothetical protein
MRKEALLLLSVCSAFLLLTVMLGASKRVRAACCQLVIELYTHAVQEIEIPFESALMDIAGICWCSQACMKTQRG